MQYNMNSRGTVGEPISFVPPPRFLSNLAQDHVERACGWQRGRTLVIRGESTSRVWVLEIATRFSTLVCSWVDPHSSPPRRIPLSAGPDLEPEIAECFQRFLWAMGAGSDSGYSPKPCEIDYRDLIQRLMGTTDCETQTDGDESFASRDDWSVATRLFLELSRGKWGRLLPAVSKPISPTSPTWWRILLTFVAGDVLALRALAHPTPPHPEAPILDAAIFYAAGFSEAALSRYEAAAQGVMGKRKASLCLEIGRLHQKRGHGAQSTACFLEALSICPDDDELLLRVCDEWIRVGEIDLAHQALANRCHRGPWSPKVVLLYTELLLWAEQTETALPLLNRLTHADLSPTETAHLHRNLGVSLALAGKVLEAVCEFEAAVTRCPHDMESLAWLGEIHLRLGNIEEADRHIATSRALSQTPVHALLTSALRDPGTLAKRWELHHILEALGQPLTPWLSDPKGAALEVLSLFGGNRGPWLTCKTRQEGRPGCLGLTKVTVPATDQLQKSRNESAQTLRLIATLPPEDVAGKLDALADRFPQSPHPHCYHGELLLWMGDYDGAMVHFEQALKRLQARWGYVGKAATFIMMGRYKEAKNAIEQCHRVFTPVVGATTPVYVGEMLRLMGDNDGAIGELTEAVRTKPGRIGAWINLALCRIAIGDHDGALSICERLLQTAPVLLWDAQSSLGNNHPWPIQQQHWPEVLKRTLVMMRGNRSSHTITYFDSQGRLKISRDGEQIRRLAQTQSPFLASALLTKLVGGINP